MVTKSCRLSREQLLGLRKEYTVQEIANQFQVAKVTVEKWITLYGIKYHEARYGSLLPNELTPLQLNVITGNMLGDGTIPYTKKGNSSFIFLQSRDKEEYVRAIHQVMSPFGRKLEFKSQFKPNFCNGRIDHKNHKNEKSHSVRFRTAASDVFTRLRGQWYGELKKKKSPKIVPVDLQLNWLTTAIWFCDDGSHWGPLKAIRFYTDGFTETDVELLIAKVRDDLHIRSKRWSHRGRPTIKIHKDDYGDFLHNVKCYIPWECMRYKLDGLKHKR